MGSSLLESNRGSLKLVGTGFLPAISPFFYDGENLPKGLSTIDDHFNDWFLGKRDGLNHCCFNVRVRYFDLTEKAIDQSIIGEIKKISSDTTPEIALGRIIFIFENQKILLTKESSNVFYVTDKNGDLRAVHLSWNPEDGWIIRAESMADCYRDDYGRTCYYPWDNGSRFFCAQPYQLH